jgi:AraC-like DNA-binding protein
VTEDASTTVALCWVLPFLQISGVDPRSVATFDRAGVSLADFANPEARISLRLALELLQDVVAWSTDPCLALHAGECHTSGDLGVVELAARSCRTLREALACVSLHVSLLHDGLRPEVVEDVQRATWHLRSMDDVPRPAAANDFAVASAYRLVTRYVSWRGGLREVHVRHAMPSDLSSYERVFHGAELRFGMPTNALVFAASFLDAPMTHAHHGFYTAYHARAESLGRDRDRQRTASARARRIAFDLVRQGDATMPAVARKLNMSTATLRRRLQEEGTSHSQIVDDVRRELAELYLSDRALPIGDIVALTGFSHVAAFYRAFRRWSGGKTPGAYRTMQREREQLARRGSTAVAPAEVLLRELSG